MPTVVLQSAIARQPEAQAQVVAAGICRQVHDFGDREALRHVVAGNAVGMRAAGVAIARAVPRTRVAPGECGPVDAVGRGLDACEVEPAFDPPFGLEL